MVMGVDILWVGVRYICRRVVKIRWVGVSIYDGKGGQYTMGRGVDIPWVVRSIYHG